MKEKDSPSVDFLEMIAHAQLEQRAQTGSASLKRFVLRGRECVMMCSNLVPRRILASVLDELSV